MNAAMAARQRAIEGKAHVQGRGLVPETDPAAVAMMAARDAEANEQKYIHRATRALNKRQERDGNIIQQPSASRSYIHEVGGRRFAVLANVSSILGVYAIQRDGQMRFVKPGNWADLGLATVAE